jgi:hypothetical protein
MRDMELLNVADVARILRCSKPLIYKMVTRGQLPSIKWDAPGQGERQKTTIRFRLDDILGFIDRHFDAGKPH